MPEEMVHVAGAGTMGSGLAQLLARTGHAVVLLDTAAEPLERARARIQELTRFDRLVAGAGACDPQTLLSRIRFTTAIEELRGAACLLENVTESRDAKREFYATADRICPPGCIFISNTSAMPVAELAAFTQRPDRVIGAHFMNPVARIRGVELVPGPQTSAATVERARALITRLGKTPVPIRDGAGFVTNRLLMGFINEAARLVADGIAEPEQIDRICRECFGHPMGPLETADLIGLDTIVQTLAVLEQHFPGDRYRPAGPLTERVRAGSLGRKSGAGFHRYEAP
jgi:3-hydroxybutyryl-CoA dehydrogenase